MRFVSSIFALLLVSACGQGFSGTYEDAIGSRYSFKSNGKVTVNVHGIEQEMRFERDGDTLRLGIGSGGALILTIQGDVLMGSLGSLQKVDD